MTALQTAAPASGAAINNPNFNRVFIVFIVLGFTLTASNFLLPAGSFLPTWLLIPQTIAFGGMLLLHLARCMGIKTMLVFFVTAMAWEFLSEQIDIYTQGGWYGAHFLYSGYWGPRLMGVPIVVPVAIAVLVWPAFCAVSMLLYGNYRIDHSDRSWLESIIFAVLCGIFISWMPALYEAICINMGAYTYPQILSGERPGIFGLDGKVDLQYPFGAHVGYAALTALQVLTLVRFIGPSMAKQAPNEQPPLHKLMDLVPVGFFMLNAITMVRLGMSMEMVAFGIYSGVTFGALALFAFYRHAFKH